MSAKPKWNAELSEFLHSTANGLVQGVVGTDTNITDLESALKTSLLTSFTNEELIAEMVDQAVKGVIQSSVDRYSKDDDLPHQTDLLESAFSPEYLNSILKLDDGFICHHGEANYDMLVGRRDRQQANVDHAQAKLDKTEVRLSLLTTVGMHLDPKMTMSEAVRLLKS